MGEVFCNMDFCCIPKIKVCGRHSVERTLTLLLCLVSLCLFPLGRGEQYWAKDKDGGFDGSEQHWTSFCRALWQKRIWIV